MIKRIAILGSGTMGYGIAVNFALAGCIVRVIGRSECALQAALKNMQRAMHAFVEEGLHTAEDCAEALKNISLHMDRDAACRDVDMVVEALPEQLELKQDAFLSLDAVCKPDCLFITGTSGLKLSDVMKPLGQARRQYCMLAHYFNPAQIIPLVELFALEETLPETIAKVEELYRRAKKVTVLLKKEVSGMAGNRIQAAVCREAFRLLEDGVCSYEDLGKVMTFGPCFRYAAADYLEIIDMGGVDLWFTVYDRLFKELNNAVDASVLLRDKAKAGELGLKTGQGFYRYDEKTKEQGLKAYVWPIDQQLF